MIHPVISLLSCGLSTINGAAVTLADSAIIVVVFCASCALEARSLAAVAGAAHHVFAERAALLDGCLQVLISLFLDCLCVL